MLYISATESDKNEGQTDNQDNVPCQISFYKSNTIKIILKVFKYPILSFHKYVYSINYESKLDYCK